MNEKRVLVGLILSGLFAWIVLSKSRNREGTESRYLPYLFGGVLPIYVGTTLVLNLFNGWSGVAQQAAFWIFSIFLHISLYFILLALALPFLRRHVQAGACAMLWIIPSYLYLTGTSSLMVQPGWIISLPGNLVGAAAALWLGGFLAVMGWKIFSHLRFRKWLLRGAEVVADPDVLTVWEAEKARAGVENPEFHLVTSDRTDTPLTIGLFAKHVRVVLPKRHYTSQELELIFRHELVHIGREDAWNKFFLAFCTAMCWFNPLMWLAMRKSSEDMELSCDETVLRGLDEGERRGYADLILRTAGDGRGFTTCLSASASALRYRLKSIMKPGKKLPGAFLVGVVFFLLFLTCGQVGLAYGAETGETHIYQDRQDFSLRLVDWADQGAGVSAVCRNEEGLRDDLASLTLLKLAGGYSFEGKEGRLFLLYDAPDAALCVVLWGDYVWVAPYRDGGLLDYDCYYVSGGLDWERLSQFFAMNSEEARS